MTDGLVVQEEEALIDGGVGGCAPAPGDCSSPVTLGGIQIITTLQLIKTSSNNVL